MTTPFDICTTRVARSRLYQKLAGRAAIEAMLPDELADAAERELILNDLFYLIVGVLGRRDCDRDWIFDRCCEVQADPDGNLDLWAREHYKSTIITLGMTIQSILRDPEATICIFSHTRPNAKKFLRQIKTELEGNEKLKRLFPDVLWSRPKIQAPKWSEDDGLIVRRTGNPREATLEAWGLDAAPTGAHFLGRVYDDIIDIKHVRNPDMIKKTIENWELSLALGRDGGWVRYIGTRYHFNDPYREIISRGAAIPRIKPATKNGQADGEPVLMSRAELTKRRREWGVYTFGAQMLQDPTADKTQGFKIEWLHDKVVDIEHTDGLNRYILVDPATAKKAESDYTAMVVIGLGHDGNYYLVDMVRDRLNLKERASALFALHRRWRPLGVGYEKYGLQCDIEFMRIVMAEQNYRFDITELGGTMAKHDRIRRLVPIFETGRFYIQQFIRKKDYEQREVDLTQGFIEEEYKPFPVGLHEDVFDAMARITDPGMNLIWPKPKQEPEATDRYARPKKRRRNISPWAA